MSSGFISEAEIEERKKARQEEWERVRQPDQPLEAPEEDYDHRSLFERLQEQKQKREFEFEESHRLKHMIKGLDDDEVEFLDLVDRSKLEEERKKHAEEAREMADFRNRVATLQEQTLENRIQQEIKSLLQPVKNTNKSSQTKLLAGAVVKKRPSESQNVDPKRPRIQSSNGEDKKSTSVPAEEEVEPQSVPQVEHQSVPQVEPQSVPQVEPRSVPQVEPRSVPQVGPPLQCIGILPGLQSYYDDSSDSSSSNSDTDSASSTEYDLLGRKIPNVAKDHKYE